MLSLQLMLMHSEQINLDTMLVLKHKSLMISPGQVAPKDSTSPVESPTCRKHTSRSSREDVGITTDTFGLNGAEMLDLSEFTRGISHHPEDPLGDEAFFKAHRKAERREKSLRNIEKEKTMHEKDHLERLLDGLKGPDWLRVIGVSAIPDGDLKRLQDKRNYFIREIKSLLRKFQRWREEEKRLRVEKEAGLDDHSVTGGKVVRKVRSSGQVVLNDNDSIASEPPLPQQNPGTIKLKIRLTPRKAPPEFTPPRPPTPDGPFLSFYRDPVTRQKALGGEGQFEANIAFGQPLPNLDMVDFELPEEYILPEALKECARRRRREKRESVMNYAKRL